MSRRHRNANVTLMAAFLAAGTDDFPELFLRTGFFTSYAYAWTTTVKWTATDRTRPTADRPRVDLSMLQQKAAKPYTHHTRSSRKRRRACWAGRHMAGFQYDHIQPTGRKS